MFGFCFDDVHDLNNDNPLQSASPMDVSSIDDVQENKCHELDTNDDEVDLADVLNLPSVLSKSMLKKIIQTRPAMKAKHKGVQKRVLELNPLAVFTDLTPKALSTTRWSARLFAIKPLHRNLKKILAALGKNI